MDEPGRDCKNHGKIFLKEDKGMGNRAVITTKDAWKNCGVGVYLHWNGGRDSVEAFLKYCELKGYRAPDKDCYGWARLCQVIGHFFGGGSSVGIDTLWHLDRDNGDNGVYIIEDWKITDRIYFDGDEQDSYEMNRMLLAIDEAQPEQIRPFLEAEERLIDDIAIGETIVILDWNGEIREGKVVGIGAEGKKVNGQNVEGIPYLDIYHMNGHPEDNINNYLSNLQFRVKKEESEAANKHFGEEVKA
jgi:hypothetical protein